MGSGEGAWSVQSHHHGEAVVGQLGKLLARLLGEDEGVELAVGLQRTSPVDADDVPVRQDQGLGGGDVRFRYRVTGQWPTITHR